MTRAHIHDVAGHVLAVAAIVGGIVGVISLAHTVSAPVLALALMLVSGGSILVVLLANRIVDDTGGIACAHLRAGTLIWLALAANFAALSSTAAYLALVLIGALCLIARLLLRPSLTPVFLVQA